MVIIKMNRSIASVIVEIFTNFFEIMLMLVAISIIPVRIIVYAPRGMNDVSIPT